MAAQREVRNRRLASYACPRARSFSGHELAKTTDWLLIVR